jgi:hypothetical protein
MTAVQLGLLIGSLIATTAGFIYVAVKLSNLGPQSSSSPDILGAAEDEVKEIFNEEFREELKNRGRLHFENIINENAMFLQQDLRLTGSQINEFMKGEVTQKLKGEFDGYQQSIEDAKKMAVEAIAKTQESIEKQHHSMSEQLSKEVEAEKLRAINRFQDNMGEIVNHYVMGAIGNQIDLDSQMDFILGELESNKEDIVKDIQNGA